MTQDISCRRSVGERLAITRAALGYSQKDFAESAGLKPSAYNQYETGYKLPSVNAAISLCDRHKLTLDWIFRGDPSGLRYETAAAIHALRSLREAE